MLRFAGTALKNTGKFLINNMGQGPGEIAMRIVPDVGFGVMAGMQTPGDLGDKLIAGATQAGGGILGGVATGGALRNMGVGQAGQTIGDMFGSYAGDFGGMAIGDGLQRAKDGIMGGQGRTAWERMGDEQQLAMEQQMRQQIEREMYMKANPNTMVRWADPSTGDGVA